MTNNFNIKRIEDFPLDSLILYSLREFSSGNVAVAENLHNIFQLKLKESLKQAQKYIENSDNFKADNILSNIAKAKIAQSEWIYLATEKLSNDRDINIKRSKSFSPIKDIYEDLVLSKNEFNERQDKKLQSSFINKDYNATSNRAKQLFVINPYNKNYYKYYGLAQNKMGNYVNAIKAFENALKFNSNCPELLFYIGQANFKLGIISHAELFVRKSLNLKNDSLRSNKLLGEILIIQKNYIEAEYYLLKAYKINNFSASVCANLSFCLLKQNKISNAYDYALLSCKIEPKNHRFFNNLGLILKEKKLYIKAKAAFLKAIKISPKYAEAHNNLGTLLQFNQPDKAIYHYNIAEKDKSILFEVFLNKASAYRQQEDHKLALKYVKKSIKINPTNHRCNKLMGILYLDKGNFSRAKFYLRQALKYKPYEPETYRLLSKISKLKNFEIKNLIKLLNEKYFTKNEEKHILFLLAEFFHNQKNYMKSWQYLNRANNQVSRNLNYKINQDIKRIFKIKRLYNTVINTQNNFKFDNMSFIFVIGLPRSGSTLIEQILSCGDGVYAGGEINIIPNEIDKILSIENHKTELIELLNIIRNTYLKHIKNKTNKSIIVDKMPYNFQNVGIIKTIFPSAKFIHIHRNPMDNFYSLYKTYFSNNSHAYTYDLNNIYNFYTIYKKFMTFWKKIYINSIFDLEYESLVHKPEENIKKMISFCEIKWDKIFLQPDKNKKEVFTASAFQIREKLNFNSVGNWKNYYEELSHFEKLI